jgi:hypothetical protein
MNRAVIAVVVVIVTLFLAFIAGTAQGAPARPTAQFGGTITPGAGQTLQVQLSTQFYSLVAPNTIFQPGSKFVYSATETGSTSGPTVLAINQTAAPTAVKSEGAGGTLYTVTSSFTLTTVAICSGDACLNAVENITIQATAYVSTYEAFWTSPQATIVLSSSHSFYSVPAQPAPDPNGFYLEFYGVITLALAVDLILGAVAFSRPEIAVLGGIAFGVFAVEMAFWTSFL